MVRVTAPALSLDASGSLAGALVFSKWKGRNYVRSLVKPSNPKSGAQVGVRAMFKFLSQEWAQVPAVDQATWEALAEQDVVSTFNAYMKANLLRNRNFLAPSEATPAAVAGLVDAIDTFTATAGERQITIALNTIGPVNGAWGFLLYRSVTTGFTPAFDNLIAVIHATQTTVVNFVDTPLDPDEYFYDAKPFSEDASIGALDGEISATVT
jgi:hypothetical protein